MAKQMKALIVVYSRTGNTKYIAELLAKKLKTDVDEIIDKARRKGALGYVWGGIQAVRKKHTNIEKTKFHPKDYDLILLGCPVWAAMPPPALRAYVMKNDLKNKKIALFCTQTKSGYKRMFGTIKKMLPKTKIVGEFCVNMPKEKGKVEEKVKEFVKTLAL